MGASGGSGRIGWCLGRAPVLVDGCLSRWSSVRVEGESVAGLVEQVGVSVGVIHPQHRHLIFASCATPDRPRVYSVWFDRVASLWSGENDLAQSLGYWSVHWDGLSPIASHPHPVSYFRQSSHPAFDLCSGTA